MQKVDHPNCVQLFEIYETTVKLHMVMEILSGGELFDRIVSKGSYSEKEAADVILTLAGALQYLHDHQIVHRDLKPENLIYASDHDDALLKVTDFGLAKYGILAGSLTTACGTPGYVAPEVLEGKKYGREVDYWSLGVILYILLCGFPPFYDESTTGLYRQIKKGQYDFPSPYWDDISSNAKNVVRGLLTVNSSNRWGADTLLATRWVVGEASAKVFETDYVDTLRLHVAKRHLRKGVRAVIAVNRFARALERARVTVS